MVRDGGSNVDAVEGGRARNSTGLIGLVALTLLAAGIAMVVERTTRALPRLGPARDVYDGDIGDPAVLVGPADQYYLFGTNDWPAHVPTARATALTKWQAGPDALPVAPRWAGPDPTGSLTWAPAAVVIGHRYLLYVSVPEARSGRECIAVESSADPAGPYTDAANGPLVCQRDLGGSIDPSVVRDRADGLHLLWKNDGNCCQQPVSLWEQDLTADGLAVVRQPQRLLSADQSWQGGIIENPAMTPASDGGWWLFYSGNAFERAAYGTGLAYCATVRGPCQDTMPGPFLATHGVQFSPGGLETFRDNRGANWVVYAIWNRPSRNGRYYCCRSVYLAPLLTA